MKLSKQYEKELSKTSSLSQDKLKELFKDYNNGNQKAFNLLIESNLKLVIHLSKSYHSNNREDLIQEGNIGLMTAIKKFNPNINIMFSTYASYWIRKAFNEHIINDNTIRIPQNIYYQMKKNDEMIKRIIDDFEEIFERIETEEIEDDNEEQIMMIQLAARHITDEEYLVLSRFFGIGREKETLVDIAKDLNVTRQRTHQIKENALTKIRKILKVNQ